jgi:hypothetical protein
VIVSSSTESPSPLLDSTIRGIKKTILYAHLFGIHGVSLITAVS